jgi:hypothetical protein
LCRPTRFREKCAKVESVLVLIGIFKFLFYSKRRVC